MAQLVELTVIWKKALGDESQETPVLHCRRTVVELSALLPRHTDKAERSLPCTGIYDLLQSQLRRVQKRLLQEQITTGIAGDTELRKHTELRAGVLCRLDLLNNNLRIIKRIGDTNFRSDCRCPNKTVPHIFLPFQLIPAYLRRRSSHRLKVAFCLLPLLLLVRLLSLMPSAQRLRSPSVRQAIPPYPVFPKE